MSSLRGRLHHLKQLHFVFQWEVHSFHEAGQKPASWICCLLLTQDRHMGRAAPDCIYKGRVPQTSGRAWRSGYDLKGPGSADQPHQSQIQFCSHLSAGLYICLEGPGTRGYFLGCSTQFLMYNGLTLVKNSLLPFPRMLTCCHDRYSSTLARFCRSEGYQ